MATNPFNPTCGLRQGDPLSPYLFLFSMDIFSHMISLATDIRSFQGIHIRRQGPIISHLFFADDAMLFFHPSIAVCSSIKDLIDRFCLISGQVVNLRKSFSKFSPNIPSDIQSRFESILHMESNDEMGTYLGIYPAHKGATLHASSGPHLSTNLTMEKSQSLSIDQAYSSTQSC